MSETDQNVPDQNITVMDVAEWARLEIHVDGRLAGFVNYRIEPGTIAFTHTQIDGPYEGKGLAGVLVRSALDTARTRHLSVRPECPYVRRWIERHEDYQDLLSAG